MCGSQGMNSALVLLVQVRTRAVSIVMDTSGLQETALFQLHKCREDDLFTKKLLPQLIQTSAATNTHQQYLLHHHRINIFLSLLVLKIKNKF